MGVHSSVIESTKLIVVENGNGSEGGITTWQGRFDVQIAAVALLILSPISEPGKSGQPALMMPFVTQALPLCAVPRCGIPATRVSRINPGKLILIFGLSVLIGTQRNSYSVELLLSGMGKKTACQNGKQIDRHRLRQSYSAVQIRAKSPQ